MTKYFLLLIIPILSSCENDVRKQMEQAYFEGQRDALTNDIRIKRNQDSCWIWIKSPWNSDRQPVFNPSFNCK